MKKLIAAISFTLVCSMGAAQRLTITYDTAWFFRDAMLKAPAFDHSSMVPETKVAMEAYSVSAQSVVIDIDSERIVRGVHNQYPDCDVLDELFYFPLELYLNVMCYYATCDAGHREVYYLVTPKEGYVDGEVSIYVGYFEEDGGFYGYHAQGDMVVENHSQQATGP
jgi:hypothetical protein